MLLGCPVAGHNVPIAKKKTFGRGTGTLAHKGTSVPGGSGLERQLHVPSNILEGQHLSGYKLTAGSKKDHFLLPPSL